jgi:hypothetical protein
MAINYFNWDAKKSINSFLLNLSNASNSLTCLPCKSVIVVVPLKFLRVLENTGLFKWSIDVIQFDQDEQFVGFFDHRWIVKLSLTIEQDQIIILTDPEGQDQSIINLLNFK